MERTLIKNLSENIGKAVSVSGWVSVRRDQGKLVFFEIRDRSGSVQGVVLPKSDAIEAAKGVRPEYVVSISGQVNKRPEKNVNPNVQNGDIELEIQEIEILSKAETPFELGAELNLDTYLDHLPYTVRSPRARDIFALQATIIEAFRDSLRKRDFVEFQAPAIVGGDAEGGAAAFKVDYYYDQKAYLATSPQLYKQIMVGAFERVFTTPKIWRAEKHATPRHLSELTQMDFEMGFIKDHFDVMDALETTMRDVVAVVRHKHADALQRFNVELPKLPNEKFPILKLKEAQELLGVPHEPDLEPEQERLLHEWALKEHDSDFVFVTHFPTSKRPFYTYEDPEDSGHTRYFDLLFRGLEINSGGQRVHEHDVLVERIRQKGLDPEKFAFYLQTFKVGMPPHGGCSTGLERLTARMLGLANIREATLFPRDMTRIDARLSENTEEET
ncbi:aspartate--tRNA(Asn) ligase [Candidatus Kaiserbacteria bacterium RIFCSPHIGHO2_01_FULL_50_13]|uniref:Aspartate--tRNA ligase n=1 Tax=Candidatus Kaiserbacteria bacterium RIFCSPLOWO2_01_FULL_50_24 TaxID=1798507 RepID=A0A1F6EMS8_9BACT|nr:MAG: aspartate--tRNA(Asn) ligase [Candidatus Kaiserbacteria bacterium RIFCSPHIGHO2_01_FULL_50_13]OGG74958.1 MAG: aspartate--tRNA(Asn) ligase [Candidatus Kaiserbacteria bacterium RIFCSPLOWO2_01_FULL_50_24]OGG81760.1 MAG: aspartate--tRNA(Asn) ligase [Candidatus Kaiserbacteria bacterium RIFCSPLOWO2_02_FULL_51_13]